MSGWQEIRGFTTPDEYDRFVDFIDEQLASGQAEEVTVDQSYGRGEIYGGKWYRRTGDRTVWRLIAPDPPFYGLWERVVR